MTMSRSYLHHQRSPLLAVQFAWVHWYTKCRQNVVIFSVRHALRLQLMHRVNALAAGKELLQKNSLEYSFLRPVDWTALLKIWLCKFFNTIFHSLSGSIVQHLVGLWILVTVVVMQGDIMVIHMPYIQFAKKCLLKRIPMLSYNQLLIMCEVLEVAFILVQVYSRKISALCLWMFSGFCYYIFGFK